MSEKNVNVSGGGTSILGLLGVVFVTLKLTGVIAWSWWLVTAPFWGGLAVDLCFLAVVALIALFGLVMVGIASLFN